MILLSKEWIQQPWNLLQDFFVRHPNFYLDVCISDNPDENFFWPTSFDHRDAFLQSENYVRSNEPHIKPAKLIYLSPSSYNSTNNK